MSAALIEREVESARIDGFLDATRAGAGGLLLIIGPAGIGKTVLLRCAAARGGHVGMRVLKARGGELEGGFSFGVARQLFEQLLADAGVDDREALVAGAARRAVAALEDEAGDPPLMVGGDPSFAVIHGLYWLAVNACGLAPLLVLIDDLHWADQATLGFVLYLAARLEGLPIALLLSWRAGESSEDPDRFARLEQIAGGEVLFPAPLSVRAVNELLAAAFDRLPSDAFAEACQRVTAGNPFLLWELVGSLRADGIDPGEAAAEQVAQLGPRSVGRAVSLRVARLGPAAAALAGAVAILGDGAQLRHASTLADVALVDAAGAADRLAEIGVFERGTPLRFVHAIVRAAVHEDIPPAELGVRHAEAARLLAAEGADPDEVCAHLMVCEPMGSPDVVERLRAGAARAFARGAPQGAAVYLRRALAETAHHQVRGDLLYELGVAEKLLREPAAIEHLREALALASDPSKRAAIGCEVSELLAYAGQWDLAASLTKVALQELSQTDAAKHSSAAVRLQTFWAGFAAYDPNLVAEFDERLEELLITARDDEGRTLAALLACVMAWRSGGNEPVPTLLEHALDHARSLSGQGADAMLIPQALGALVCVDELDRASGIIEELLASARTRGEALSVAVGLCYRVAVQARRGELAGAETDLRAVLELVQERALAFGLPQLLHLGIDVLIERPDLADLAALAGAAELPTDLARTASGAMLHEAKGRLALADANPAAAAAQLQQAATTYEALRVFNPNFSCWRCALALTLGGENPDEALRLVDSELNDARRLGFSGPVGIVLRTRGLLQGGEQGLSDLRQAVGVLERSHSRLEHARALVELGAARRRANQRTAARAPLRAGLDLAHRCGAIRLQERARAELQATGARPRRVMLSGAEALTASERRVAELAARGMSNPEIAQALFVTLNTVEGHLRHTYQKLSINSRQQLPEALETATVGALPSVAGR